LTPADEIRTFRPTEAVISLDALACNLETFRSLVATAEIMAVVKADAYGHGAVKCSKRLVEEGVSNLAVATCGEAIELRLSGIEADIVVLGSIFPGEEAAIVEFALEPMVCSREAAEHINDAARRKGKTVNIHVKVDTGMSRLGIDASEVSYFANFLNGLSHLRVKGIMTHFPVADDPAKDDFTNAQIELFDQCIDAFRKAGHTPNFTHLANSPGALAHRSSRRNIVRIGGGLYGLLDDIMQGHHSLPRLKPVMALRSAITGIRDIGPGTGVGYGLTFIAQRPTRLAQVPIGYADGYPRGLSNKGFALIRGERARVAGIVSMDWTIFDVTDIPDASVGDEVILIGSSGEHSITSADLAGLAGTIGYEITCGISKRVPRRYVP
jgi:alanine racemase